MNQFWCLSPSQGNLFQNYRQNQQIHGGMIPKLDNAFRSLQQGVNDIRIGNPQSLADGRATQIYLD